MNRKQSSAKIDSLGQILALWNSDSAKWCQSGNTEPTDRDCICQGHDLSHLGDLKYWLLRSRRLIPTFATWQVGRVPGCNPGTYAADEMSLRPTYKDSGIFGLARTQP